MDVTAEKIYETALGFIGKDASPSDLAPDEFGCAETVSDILRAAGCDLPVTLSTLDLYNLLNKSARWLKTPSSGAQAGDVIISPTSMGGGNGITHGHTGIYFDNFHIASNDSATGKFSQNYTTERWRQRYSVAGRYPVFVFHRIDPVAPPGPTVEQKIAVASEAVKVATEAAKSPSLRQAALTLLKTILAFLQVDKLGAILGINSKIKPPYLG